MNITHTWQHKLCNTPAVFNEINYCSKLAEQQVCVSTYAKELKIAGLCNF
jgi:hypothetical protein